jgi:vitamin-K-epoxide reductase (warfarin-sensitive)
MWVRILALMGIALSLYSMHVEIEKARYGDAYKPACDLTEEIKCSKALAGEHTHILVETFGISRQHGPLYQSNATLGLAFFLAVFLISLPPFNRLPLHSFAIFISGILSLGAALFFGYYLFFVLRDMCPVCLATYVVNILLFIVATKQFFASKPQNKRTKSNKKLKAK